MATCNELDIRAKQEANILTEYTSRANSILSGGLTGSAEQLNDRRNDAISTKDILSSAIRRLENIKAEQSAAGCTVTGYRPQINAATAAIQKLTPFITQSDAKIDQLVAQEERAATENAAQTNNSGANIPAQQGRAGVQLPSNTVVDDPNADIPEITVVGNRIKQEPLQIGEPGLIDPGAVTVNAPNFDLGEDLEEVTVTGNRLNRGNLQIDEPGMIGAGPINVDAPPINLDPADELEEVTVTGRRVPTTTGAVQETRKQASLRESTNFNAKNDWRVRLSLAPGTNYLYNDDSAYLLEPLRLTDGILFPYTPSINITYAANYSAATPAHSNYKFFQYENSYVDNITIGCDFTAQDSSEAAYVLAVIHFLRSVTKMFYGQDQNPKLGTPPPLCYLFGLGQFQFNAHPLVINSFNYSLPTDVDYIRVPGGANIATGPDGVQEVPVNAQKETSKTKSSVKQGWGVIAENFIKNRLGSGIAAVGNVLGLNLSPGGEISSSNWVNSGFNPQKFTNVDNPTYVPTKITIQIGAHPMISRYEVSTEFSVKKYASGELLNGVARKGAGFW